MRKFWRPIVLLVLAVVVVPTVSGSVEAQTGSCANGVAVYDAADYPGLVADCEVLLAVRDTLAGSGSLNWSADVAIERWDGIGVGGSPRRVVEVRVGGRSFKGWIPAELGRLSNLEKLHVRNGWLSGPIPAELGNLSNLTELDLYQNQLSGSIPPELGSLSRLRILRIHSNRMGGSIPSELGNLSNLEELNLEDNQLSGSIPPALGDLSSLVTL